MAGTTYMLCGFGTELNWRLTCFLEPLPPSRKCTYCGRVCATMMMLPCSHIVCAGCYGHCTKRKNACALDAQHFQQYDVAVMIYSVEDLASKHIRCWNAGRGCKFTGLVLKVTEHYSKNCAYHIVVCSRCNQAVAHGAVIAHLASGCRQKPVALFDVQGTQKQPADIRHVGAAGDFCLSPNQQANPKLVNVISDAPAFTLAGQYHPTKVLPALRSPRQPEPQYNYCGKQGPVHDRSEPVDHCLREQLTLRSNAEALQNQVCGPLRNNSLVGHKISSPVQLEITGSEKRQSESSSGFTQVRNTQMLGTSPNGRSMSQETIGRRGCRYLHTATILEAGTLSKPEFNIGTEQLSCTGDTTESKMSSAIILEGGTLSSPEHNIGTEAITDNKAPNPIILEAGTLNAFELNIGTETIIESKALSNTILEAGTLNSSELNIVTQAITESKASNTAIMKADKLNAPELNAGTEAILQGTEANAATMQVERTYLPSETTATEYTGSVRKAEEHSSYQEQLALPKMSVLPHDEEESDSKSKDHARNDAAQDAPLVVLRSGTGSAPAPSKINQSLMPSLLKRYVNVVCRFVSATFDVKDSAKDALCKLMPEDLAFVLATSEEIRAQMSAECPEPSGTVHEAIGNALQACRKEDSENDIFSQEYVLQKIDNLINRAKQVMIQRTLVSAPVQWYLDKWSQLKARALAAGEAADYFHDVNVTFYGYSIVPGLLLENTTGTLRLHVSFYVRKGIYDSFLEWPIKKEFTLSIIHSTDKGKVRFLTVNTEKCHVDGCTRPESKMGKPVSRAKSLKADYFDVNGYVDDDKLLLKFEVK